MDNISDKRISGRRNRGLIGLREEDQIFSGTGARRLLVFSRRVNMAKNSLERSKTNSTSQTLDKEMGGDEAVVKLRRADNDNGRAGRV